MSRLKHIKPYQIFEASAAAPALTQEQIDWLDKCVQGSWKYNSQTGLVDLHAYRFDCSKQGLTDLKGVKFGKVSGYFNCENNELTSLEGAPQSVGGDFHCYSNQLTSLVGAPQTVGMSFVCHDNQLTSLEGAPQSVGGDFSCANNQLTTLEGSPQKVGRYFNCHHNQLTTLEGAPKTVDGGFYCEGNPVSESTLKAIFALMKKGMAYQQALEKRWPKMKDEDRVLMYKDKDHFSLSPEDAKKYKALVTYSNIKNYL